MQLYREGRTFEELQMGLALATGGGPGSVAYLDEQERTVLTSWVALVMLTLEELGVPRDLLAAGAAGMGSGVDSGSMDVEAQARTGERSPYLMGMLDYVKQTLGLYDNGTSLAMLSGLQAMVRDGAPPSPAMQVRASLCALAPAQSDEARSSRLPCSVREVGVASPNPRFSHPLCAPTETLDPDLVSLLRHGNRSCSSTAASCC